MRNKRIIIAAVTVTLLLSTGIALAATQQSWNGSGNNGAQGNGGNDTGGLNGAAICTTEQIQEQETSGTTNADNGGTGTIAATGTLTTDQAEMLIAAIQDEYNARAEYEALIDAFGEVRPFTNIIDAEVSHIDALGQLFEAYGVSVPEDNGAAYAVVPDTLTEALQAGIEAETKNIAMYEEFLKQELPEDLRTVFQSLMDASENHQVAFERRLDALS